MDNKKFYSIKPQKPLEVNKLYDILYYENFAKYIYEGEAHDFWELVYVDRGQLYIFLNSNEKELLLQQGDIILIRPNLFHSLRALDNSPHNLVIVAFSSHCGEMKRFEKQYFYNSIPHVRSKIEALLRESNKAFVPYSDLNSTLCERRMRLNNSVNFGAEQIVSLYLEAILIELYRSSFSNEKNSESLKKEKNSAYVSNAIEYLKANLGNKISLADVCTHINLSAPQLQKVFVSQKCVSVMKYLTIMRINEAKYLILCGKYTFTQIAYKLSYSSLHHFSAGFKKVVGMSPTEYVNSVNKHDSNITASSFEQA